MVEGLKGWIREFAIGDSYTNICHANCGGRYKLQFSAFLLSDQITLVALAKDSVSPLDARRGIRATRNILFT